MPRFLPGKRAASTVTLSLDDSFPETSQEGCLRLGHSVYCMDRYFAAAGVQFFCQLFQQLPIAKIHASSLSSWVGNS